MRFFLNQMNLPDTRIYPTHEFAKRKPKFQVHTYTGTANAERWVYARVVPLAKGWEVLFEALLRQ